MEKLQVAGQKGVIKKKSKAGCVRYAECERNHAVKDGGSAVDGCKEFIASDENGGSALTCSCCGCHRNFHRVVEEIDQESIGVGEQKKRKIRELKSKVWDDFTKSVDKNRKELASCKHCKKQFDGSSKNGTSRLLKHLMSKKCRAMRYGGDGNEDVSTQIRDLGTLTPVVMKEKPSVIDLIKQSFDEYGRPTEHWDPSLLNSRKDEILQVYQEEKEKLGEFLNKLSCRFSLDIHHVCDNLILMVHYIDESWERQMKIISIIPRENYIQEMKKACLDLKIDRNICSLRHHGDDDDDDDEDEIIESWFSQRSSLPFSGLGLDFEHASYEKLFDKIQVYLVVSFFDPRFKMDEVQRWYEEIYGSDANDNLEKTLKYFRDVYNEYAKESSEDYKMMDASSTKSELDLYLHHLKVPAVEGFDKLAWWRDNAPFYPTLSRMARDYLAIPIINEILFDLYFLDEMYDIKYCIEIDDDIKSALMYLSGLVYYQAKAEKNE